MLFPLRVRSQCPCQGIFRLASARICRANVEYVRQSIRQSQSHMRQSQSPTICRAKPVLVSGHRPANMAHVRQSRPDSGFDIQVKVRRTFNVVPSSRTKPVSVSGHLQAGQRAHLSSECVTYKTVTTRFWPWLRARPPLLAGKLRV